MWAVFMQIKKDLSSLADLQGRGGALVELVRHLHGCGRE